MVQTAQKTNGAADHGFPYGIDPRDYGLSKLEYDRVIDHQRRMAHLEAQQREAEQHRHEMAEARAREAAANAELEARYYWLQPVNEFCKWIGGAFWLAMWLYIILTFMVWIDNSNKAADAKVKNAAVVACLADLEKCKAGQNAALIKELAR